MTVWALLLLKCSTRFRYPFPRRNYCTCCWSWYIWPYNRWNSSRNYQTIAMSTASSHPMLFASTPTPKKMSCICWMRCISEGRERKSSPFARNIAPRDRIMAEVMICLFRPTCEGWFGVSYLHFGWFVHRPSPLRRCWASRLREQEELPQPALALSALSNPIHRVLLQRKRYEPDFRLQLLLLEELPLQNPHSQHRQQPLHLDAGQ